jgi:hypothetical protein
MGGNLWDLFVCLCREPIAVALAGSIRENVEAELAGWWNNRSLFVNYERDVRDRRDPKFEALKHRTFALVDPAYLAILA